MSITNEQEALHEMWLWAASLMHHANLPVERLTELQHDLDAALPFVKPCPVQLMEVSEKIQ